MNKHNRVLVAATLLTFSASAFSSWWDNASDWVTDFFGVGDFSFNMHANVRGNAHANGYDGAYYNRPYYGYGPYNYAPYGVPLNAQPLVYEQAPVNR